MEKTKDWAGEKSISLTSRPQYIAISTTSKFWRTRTRVTCSSTSTYQEVGIVRRKSDIAYPRLEGQGKGVIIAADPPGSVAAAYDLCIVVKTLIFHLTLLQH